MVKDIRNSSLNEWLALCFCGTVKVIENCNILAAWRWQWAAQNNSFPFACRSSASFCEMTSCPDFNQTEYDEKEKTMKYTKWWIHFMVLIYVNCVKYFRTVNSMKRESGKGAARVTHKKRQKRERDGEKEVNDCLHLEVHFACHLLLKS